MSAPSKPWESGRSQGSRMLNSSAPMIQNLLSTSGARYRTSSSGVPPLPPRPNNLAYGGPQYNNSGAYGGSMMGRQLGYSPFSNMNSYGGYGGGMGGYGGMMGGYGGGMYGNGGYGMGAESRFIQLAEESTRPAFQGIESLVRAFGSISMMLDSTYFAVTNSFRAVLGVAENFGRIRSMFAQIWSSFALIRGLNWLYRKLLSMLGINITTDMGKEAWNQAVNETVAEGAANVSSWPIFMFLGMIVSAPYFISKLLPPLIDKRDPKNWSSPGIPAVVQYQFTASNPQELSIYPGDKICLAPKDIQNELELNGTGWMCAASKRGSGLIPSSYIQAVNVRVKKTDNTMMEPTGAGHLPQEIPDMSLPAPKVNQMTVQRALANFKSSLELCRPAIENQPVIENIPQSVVGGTPQLATGTLNTPQLTIDTSKMPQEINKQNVTKENITSQNSEPSTEASDKP